MLKTTGVQIEATTLHDLTSIPFSDALSVTGALFWDRRRPRLHFVATKFASGNVCRRGRLRSQKSAPVTIEASLKGNGSLLLFVGCLLTCVIGRPRQRARLDMMEAHRHSNLTPLRKLFR